MDRQFLAGSVSTALGLLLLLLPKSFYVLEGIGYLKPLRIIASILGLLFLGYGVFLLP